MHIWFVYLQKKFLIASTFVYIYITCYVTIQWLYLIIIKDYAYVIVLACWAYHMMLHYKQCVWN